MEQNQQEDTLQDSSAVSSEKGPARVRNKYADKWGQRRKIIPKPVKRAVALLALAALIGGAVFLVHRVNSSKQDATTGTETAVAARQPLETFVEGTGTTAAKSTEHYGKNIKGQVLEVNTAVGNAVKAGDVLFKVDPKEAREQLETATSELDDAMRSVDQAQSGLRTAQKNVSNLTITVPFSGKLVPQKDSDGKEKTFRVGQDISEGTVLGTVVDDTVMRLPLYFNQTYIKKIKVGAAAKVSIPVSMSTVTGKVASVERVQKVSDEGAVLFRVIVTMKNPGTLKSGMAASASVTSGASVILPSDSGKLENNREQDITAKGAGTIVSVGELDNFHYNAGQVLCQLKSDTYQDAIGTAQRTLESAQKATVTKQKEVAEIQKRIADCTATAKINGVVTDLKVTEGQTLDGSADVCTVADLSVIVVNADISELDVDSVKPGMDVRITMDQDDSVQLTGKVKSISMQAKETTGQQGGSTRTFPAEITMDAGTAAKLSPDRTVNYQVVTASKPDCLVVPSTAVVYSDSGAAIYARQTEGKKFEKTLKIPEGSDVPEGFVLVPVQTGISDDTNTEILSGIDEGTEVYQAGPQDVNNMGQDGGVAVG